jgi:CRISPR-associated endonuclease/helicase Cas3
MMVVFVSRCEKKAHQSTRRVLDAFADRIGDDTWQSVITEEGLSMVRSLLRKSATKSTAVSCRWIRSRSRSELVWIVGNRSKFNQDGLVPVNTTQKNIQHSEWENDWLHLPQIKALTAVAGLLHDWGKASDLFQAKLNKRNKHNKKSDPLRHEWVSCVLLQALVEQSGNPSADDGWLGLLHHWTFDETDLVKRVQRRQKSLLNQLPPIAQAVAWIMLSHHRLPSLYDKNERNGYAKTERVDFFSALKAIDEHWGYKNDLDGSFDSRVNQCFEFKLGLLKDSAVFAKQAKKWAGRLIAEKDNILNLLPTGAFRMVMNEARLCLMLSDHYISSQEAEKDWKGNKNLFANTDDKSNLKQKLDEHSVRVSEQALKITQSLARFTEQMEKAHDVKSLKQKSPAEFAWQDKVVEKIKKFRKENQVAEERGQGWFVVNMASTGCGKTIANAKIMQAISEDGEGLRYILALGLRTLTLQTGDEYRDRVGLDKDELAVLIGSAAFKELHEQKNDNAGQDDTGYDEGGAESMESLLDEEMDFVEGPTADFLDLFFPPGKQAIANKNKAFLYKPVLACTIDHMIAATETTRGGKYILPFLRLMSSDLVIDEVDDFDKRDLTAIGRLVHLAGMLGRSVAFSSATIPPGLAEGLYKAYQEGWESYRSFFHTHKQPICVWCDEFAAQVETPQGSTTGDRCERFAQLQSSFVNRRVSKLRAQIVKRRAYIVRCGHLLEVNGEQESTSDGKSIEQRYFAIIKEQAEQLHLTHSFVDRKTGRKISFGVVRVANISTCIELSQYLMEADWSEEFAPKVMAYHSRQVLLLRHEQERHLDAVLKRKETRGGEPQALKDPLIRKHIDTAQGEHVLFILVATPVEEVGRDHDLDWAVIEPSSYRSIIQLVGRVWRHRKLNADIANPNVAILQYNLKALQKPNQPVFCHPGYETADHRLATHDMTRLVDEAELDKGVNAIPRISKPASLRPAEKLADLEHSVMEDFKDDASCGPDGLQGWLTGYWWITALPQQMNRFRDSAPEIKLHLLWENGKAVFKERTDKGEYVDREAAYGIKHAESVLGQERCWLPRNYQLALRKQLARRDFPEEQDQIDEKGMSAVAKKFGEISIPKSNLAQNRFSYSDQFGLSKNR